MDVLAAENVQSRAARQGNKAALGILVPSFGFQGLHLLFWNGWWAGRPKKNYDTHRILLTGIGLGMGIT